MALIDVGSPAISRGTGVSPQTYILKDNPANATGTITSIEIWANTNLVNCKVAIFYSTGTEQFSTRAYVTIGNVVSGSKQTFSGLNLNIVAGDYIGIYYSAGTIMGDTAGGLGLWHLTGDNIPCTNLNFTSVASYIVSLYATGTDVILSVGNPLFFGMNF